MTLIIGARCKDGVVVGADRRGMRGAEPSDEEKLYDMDGILVGIAGLTGIKDDFLLLVRRREVGTRLRDLYEVKLEVEDLVRRFSDRYGPRFPGGGGEEQIQALLVGLTNLRTGKATLYHVLGMGFAEEVRFLCIGHGSPYATSLGKFMYDPDLSVNEMAEVVCFLISWVKEDLDALVGGTPDVMLLKDNTHGFTKLDKAKIQAIEKHVKSIKKKGELRRCLLPEKPQKT
jgi:20S proteasome alpha/beta subunit